MWLRLRPMNLVLSELQIRYLTADWKSQPFCFTDTSNTAIQTHLISPPPSLAPNLLLNKRPHHLPNHPNPKPGGRLLFLPPPPICSSQIANSNYCEGNMQFKDSVWKTSLVSGAAPSKLQICMWPSLFDNYPKFSAIFRVQSKLALTFLAISPTSLQSYQ